MLNKKPNLTPNLNNLRPICIGEPIKKLIEAIALPELKIIANNPKVSGHC